MEMMTMSATAPEQFNVSVDENGSFNYNLSITTKTFLTAAVFVGVVAMEPLVSVSSRVFEILTPYLYISEKKSSVDEIPVLEKIQKVLSFYNLGKSHLCKIAGISRPTLYAWMEDSESESEKFIKIEQLYSIVSELNVEENTSIYHGFIDRALPGKDKSLYQLFIESNNLETKEIKELIRVALDKSISRENSIKQRRKNEFNISHSDAEKELNLDGNL